MFADSPKIRSALRLEIVRKLAHEVDRSHSRERDLHMFPLWRQQVYGIGLTQPDRVQVPAQGLLVDEHNNNLLVRRGWGLILQNAAFPGSDGLDLPIGKMYVMLSTFFLSSCCFH